MNNMPSIQNSVLKELYNLPINYRTESLSDKYLELSKKISIEDYIKYRDVREDACNKKRKKRYCDHIFHIIISVKVSADTPFIPFISVLGNKNNQDKLDELARGIQEKGTELINYNYSTFIEDLERELERSIMRISFKTTWNEDEDKPQISESRINNENPDNNHLWFEKQNKYDIRNDRLLKKYLHANNGEKRFSTVIAKAYRQQLQIHTLYFSIYSLDASFDGRGSLTKIMLIGTEPDECTFYMKRKLDKVRELVSYIRTRYVSDLIQKNRFEATKSAKAAIMSRNMSHNIGSHVMSYLKQKLGSITAIMSKENQVLYNLTDDEYLQMLLERRELNNDKILLDLIEKRKNVIPTIKKNTTDTTKEYDHSFEKSHEEKLAAKKIQFPFLVGTGRFIGYLQERQDYIATIATDYIPYGAPVNLKDAIYDELNPDLRYMRHNVDDGNRPMNVLLSFIAKSEGITREHMKVDGQTFKTENDILFGFPKYEKEDEKPHVFGIVPQNSKTDDPALTEMRKINFSLPGGLVGRQAIFSIVENLIRNAAKHGKPRNTESSNMELIFDVIDLANLDKCKCLNDRICDPIWQTLYKAADDREQLYLFTITDNLIYDKSLADKLRTALIEDYLDERGNMLPTNKGIKEIRISAAWMRDEVNEEQYLRYNDCVLIEEKGENGIPKYKLKENIHNKKAPLVGVEITEAGNLRYMICLTQDRFAAVITEGMSDEDKTFFKKLHELRPKEWKLYNSVDEARTKEESKISYHYILVAPEKYNQIRPYTSNRLYKWSPTEKNRQEINTVWQLEKNEGQNEADVELKKYNRTKNVIIRLLHNITDQSETIYIWDSKAYKERKRRIENGELECEKVHCAENDENATSAQYVYRTHHATKDEFDTYWNDRYQSRVTKTGNYGKIKCIDAITGDNSSDRIVRREPLNEEWYCSHLRAMKKRVAIIDERLFMIVHGIDENKFINKDADTAKEIATIIDRLQSGEDFQKIKDEIESKSLLKEDTINVLQRSKTPEKLINKLSAKLEGCKTTFSPQKNDNYKSIVYREKGVDVFTIMREKEGTFAVIGCVSDYTDENGEIYCKYDKVATITYKVEPFDVNIDFHYIEFVKQYDYISIHQGILDKLYDEFRIKEQCTENDSKKCHVTKRLHENFMREKDYNPIPITVKTDNDTLKEDFLPCFIIHSGRAKPTKNDMPQNLPFVQYAAIEHGVLDCKFSLIELLDYARYES